MPTDAAVAAGALPPLVPLLSSGLGWDVHDAVFCVAVRFVPYDIGIQNMLQSCSLLFPTDEEVAQLMKALFPLDLTLHKCYWVAEHTRHQLIPGIFAASLLSAAHLSVNDFAGAARCGKQ